MIPKLALLLVLAVTGTAAQAAPKFKNATGATSGTNMSPWTTTHGSRRSANIYNNIVFGNTAPGTQKNSDAKLNAIRNVRQ